MPVTDQIRDKISQLPHKPGVYLMKDRFGRVIYVGKARDLRKRVSQYFHPSRRMGWDLKLNALVDAIHDLDVHPVRSEPEALLLEGKLQEIGPKEWVCYKPRLSVFFQTPVEEHLKAIGISTIVICGTDFPASPRSTVYAAANRDFRLVLATDAISGATDAGLDEMAQIGAYLMATDKLLEWLPRNRAAA